MTDIDYGEAGRIGEAEAREHLLAQEAVRLRNLISQHGLMGDGALEIRLIPPDGSAYTIRVDQKSDEVRLTPVLDPPWTFPIILNESPNKSAL